MLLLLLLMFDTVIAILYLEVLCFGTVVGTVCELGMFGVVGVVVIALCVVYVLQMYVCCHWHVLLVCVCVSECECVCVSVCMCVCVVCVCMCA